MLPLLSLLGLVFVLIAPFFIYRAAKQNGHNPIRWTLISLAAGIGIQWIIPLIIRIIGSFLDEEGKSPLGGFAMILLLFCLILSIVAVGGIWRYVGQPRNSEVFSLNQ